MLEVTFHMPRLYTLNDAWAAWLSGEKFPVAIAGDSTVDGFGTDNSIQHLTAERRDNQDPNAFPRLLEAHLRKATGNSILRIYNAGHTGMYIKWALDNFEREWGHTSVYADVKMVGIGYGINDRLIYSSAKAYRAGFKQDVIEMVERFYEKGIQPFLLTTQAVVEPGVHSDFTRFYPLRTGESVNSIANEVKREIAGSYSLELIDVNKYTELFLQHSSYSLLQLIPDGLHLGNLGHIYEAGLLFAHFCPRTVWAGGKCQLDFSSQKAVTSVPSDKLTLAYPPTRGFKVFANYTKHDKQDIKIMDFWVFNNAKRPLSLTAYKSEVNSLTYVKINGEARTLSSLETNLGLHDLGLIHLEVYTGDCDKVDFKGFVLE
jgi:hypothetical protein